MIHLINPISCSLVSIPSQNRERWVSGVESLTAVSILKAAARRIRCAANSGLILKTQQGLIRSPDADPKFRQDCRNPDAYSLPMRRFAESVAPPPCRSAQMSAVAVGRIDFVWRVNDSGDSAQVF
jgi:hypothetical protein